MRYRETIWSDHEWSDDDDDDDDLIGESFADQDDDGDEITMDDASIEFSHASRAAYRVSDSLSSAPMQYNDGCLDQFR